jgi:hypothetical protein
MASFASGWTPKHRNGDSERDSAFNDDRKSGKSGRRKLAYVAAS